MAFDKPIVTENLPDLSGDPGPMVDPSTDELARLILRGYHEISGSVFDAIDEAMTYHWITGLFVGIGLLTVCVVAYAFAVHWWNKFHEHRAHGRVAERLARLAWDEMSPADLLYAEREWPECFALARYIDDHKAHADVRTRWLDPSLKGKERLGGRLYPELRGVPHD